MKYFIFTFYGVGLPIAYKLQQEGHEVLVGEIMKKSETVTKDEKASEDPEETKRRLSLYNGMLNKMPADKLIEKMKEVSDKSECFVFCDFNNTFKYAQMAAELGFEGNFPTEDDYKFEQDRDAAKDFVKKNYPQVAIGEKKEFQKIKDGIEFLEKTDDVWVLKGNDESGHTFVPDTDNPELAKSQIIETLQKFPDGYEKSGFILELMIPYMMEITPQKIYYDGVPLAVTIDIENKQLGSGNLSLMTGCAADLVFPVPMDERICEIAFPPIIDELAKKHKGLFIWDASLLISRKGGKIYFGEFCSNRPGYNAFFTELSQLPSISHYFESIIKFKSPFTMGTVGVSTTLFNLHRDFDDNSILKDSQIDYKEEFEKNIWMYDALKDKEKIINAGYDTNLVAVTGADTSLDDAINKMFKVIEKGFSFAGVYYRPKADYISLDYPTSIPNRLDYGIERKLYHIPFDIKAGRLI